MRQMRKKWILCRIVTWSTKKIPMKNTETKIKNVEKASLCGLAFLVVHCMEYSDFGLTVLPILIRMEQMNEGGGYDESNW